MNRLHLPTGRSLAFRLKLAGLAIFLIGVAWDLTYHTALFLTSAQPSDLVDFVGSLGHLLTLVGIVVVIAGLLQQTGHKA